MCNEARYAEPDEGRPAMDVAYMANGIAKLSLDPEHSQRFNLGWRGVRDILQSPWWKRCWIVQELLCCKKRAVIYGRYSLSWEKFEPGIIFVQEVFDVLSTFVDQYLGTEMEESVLPLVADINMQPVHKLIQLKQDWENDSSIDLKVVLDRLRDFESTDQRDRIYAVLGLIWPEYGIVPDYSDSNTMRDVLIDTVCQILRIDQNLEFLRFVEAEKSQNIPLPSWVPQWISGIEEKGHILRGRSIVTAHLESWRTRQYGDSGGIAATISVLKFPPPAAYVLHVDGIILGAVAEAETFGEWEACPTSLSALIKKWKMTAAYETGEKYFNGDDIDKALFDMLSALLGEQIIAETSVDDLREVELEQPSVDDGRNHGELSDTVAALPVWSNIGQRRFFRSPSGYIGMSPLGADPKHLLCILFGCSMPCVLMEVDSGYLFVGTAYIHGLMNGEAIQMMEEGIFKRETISIF